jgi:hypothetical protein
MPARRDEPPEDIRARGRLVEMHRLWIVFGGKRNDFGARDQPRSTLGHLAGGEIFPM